MKLEVPLDRIETIDHIPGWCDGCMMRRLQELARGLETVVNIGAWKGRSCAALAQECSGIVWAVDHWRGSPEELDTNHKQAAEDPLSVYWEFCQYMAYFGLLGTKVIPITGNSPTVARKYFRKDSIDLVFVDEGHDFNSVWTDLVTWTGRIKRGGILCGDDYSWSEVERAVLDFHCQYKRIYRLGDLQVEIDGKFWMMRRMYGASSSTSRYVW